MRYHGAILGFLACAICAGCQNRAAQELLERELRLQEDRIYQLEDRLALAKSELNDYREGKPQTTPRSESPLQRLFNPPGGIDEPAAPPFEPPKIEAPTIEIPPLTPPKIDAPAFPQQNQPPTQRPAIPPQSSRPPQIEAPPLPQYSGNGNDQASLSHDGPTLVSANLVESPATAKSRVAFVTLNKQRTGAQHQDAESNTTWLHVVIEPRNGSGQLVPTAGDVSIVVLDPSQRGTQARVARWDFAADQVAAWFQQSPAGGGLHLELEWPADRPRTHRMNLYVRFITAEGKELRLEYPLEVSGAQTSPPSSWTEVAEPVPPPFGTPTPLQPSPPVVRLPQWSPFR